MYLSNFKYEVFKYLDEKIKYQSHHILRNFRKRGNQIKEDMFWEKCTGSCTKASSVGLAFVPMTVIHRSFTPHASPGSLYLVFKGRWEMGGVLADCGGGQGKQDGAGMQWEMQENLGLGCWECSIAFRKTVPLVKML